MPAAVVLRLSPVDRGLLRVSHGRQVHAAALRRFSVLDPILGKALDDNRPHKPFTVSFLHGPVRQEGGMLTLTPGETYTWRITALDDAVDDLLRRVAVTGGGVQIGETWCTVLSSTTDSAEDVDAGEASYETLWQWWQQAAPPPGVGLQFVSPTTFRVGEDLEQPLPAPALVFRHLREQWNAHAPIPLDEWPAPLDQVVVLSNWRGETRRVDLEKWRTVGFVGRFSYHLAAAPVALRRTLGLLGEYAFYAGVGWQTTHGLGQTRVLQGP